MDSKSSWQSSSLHDFGPLARDYDRWYETPAGQIHDKLQKADVLELLPQPVPGFHLLDAGCGTGHWSTFFASMGLLVHGVDISEEMITVARAKAIPGCTFEVADMLGLPFDDASFDAAVAMATIEFTCDVDRALREMARCVRSGGTLVVGTLNRLAPLNQERIANAQEPYASARMMSPDELVVLLSSVGEVRLSATGRQEPLRPLLVAGVRL